MGTKYVKKNTGFEWKGTLMNSMTFLLPIPSFGGGIGVSP